MRIPTMTAEAALASTATYRADQTHAAGADAAIIPQLCVSTPCTNLGVGRFRARCCTRLGWPPFSCSIQAC